MDTVKTKNTVKPKQTSRTWSSSFLLSSSTSGNLFQKNNKICTQDIYVNTRVGLINFRIII